MGEETLFPLDYNSKCNNKKIQEKMGIENLPTNLQELCLVRIANPEESLENSTKLVTFPITKSGINHQFRKIVSIAKELDEKDN